MTFPPSTARLYNIQYSTDLVSGVWLYLRTGLTGEVGFTSIADTDDGAGADLPG